MAGVCGTGKQEEKEKRTRKLAPSGGYIVAADRRCTVRSSVDSRLARAGWAVENHSVSALLLLLLRADDRVSVCIGIVE